MNHELVVVLTTTEKRDDAERIAQALVQGRLCACAQVSGPIRSWYWWEGKLENAEEWLVRLKTTLAKYEKAEEAIRAVHPYDLPQIIALPVTKAYDPYIDWVVDNLDTKAADK